MFKVNRVFIGFLLLANLAWLLAACGADFTDSQNATPASSLSTMQTLEQYLNQGQVNQALDLFSEDAVVLEAKTDLTSGYYTLGGYYIPQAYSVEANENLYKGQEQVNSFLTKLVKDNFQSSNSIYREDEAGVTWLSQSANQMEFKASFQEGKIKTLIVSFS
jgi:hypothetical protein